MYLGFRGMYLVFKAMGMNEVTQGDRREKKEKQDQNLGLGAPTFRRGGSSKGDGEETEIKCM